MRYKISIPLINHSLWVYVGEDGLKDFKAKIAKSGEVFEDDALKMLYGFHYDNNIWLYEITGLETPLHEFSHYMDWLMKYIGAEDEGEFRAYLQGCVLEKYLELLYDVKVK